jgi:hypothetical protein
MAGATALRTSITAEDTTLMATGAIIPAAGDRPTGVAITSTLERVISTDGTAEGDPGLIFADSIWVSPRFLTARSRYSFPGLFLIALSHRVRARWAFQHLIRTQKSICAACQEYHDDSITAGQIKYAAE